MTGIVNPITRRPLRENAAETVLQAREARAGARRAARSGHPGRRAAALRALVGIPQFIRQVYIEEAKA